jgi:hypothetical protein
MRIKLLFSIHLIIWSGLCAQENFSTSFLEEQLGIFNPAGQGDHSYLLGVAGNLGQSEALFSQASGAVSFQYTSHKKFGLGLRLLKTNGLFEQEKVLATDFSRVLQLGKTLLLRYGFRLSGTFYEDDLTIADTTNETINGLALNRRDFVPNIGLGFLLVAGEYYLGLSVPRAVAQQELSNDSLGKYVVTRDVYYFLNGGGKLELDSHWAIRADFLVYPATTGWVENYSIRLQQIQGYEMGVSINSDSFAGLVKIVFQNAISVGYAYRQYKSDWPYINSGGRHELMLNVRWP